jgi:multiple sugar transport system ATP-binding protein
LPLNGYTGTPVEGPATLGFRPEHLLFTDPSDTTIEGTVTVVEPKGADTVIWFTWAGQTFSLRQMGDTPLRPGTPIHVQIDTTKACLFGADGIAL